ncbi:MAG TPA: tetratricopeptide repeat protein [Acidiphilium sp.]
MDRVFPQDGAMSPSALLQSGLSAYRDGDFTGAVRDFAAVLAEQPDHHGARINLANAFWSQGRFDDAGREADRARNSRPDSVAAWMITGAIRLDRGDAGGAVTAYGRAVSLDPGHAGARAGLGAAFLAAGEPGKAGSTARSCLTLDPANPHARFTLGSALAALDRPKDAIAEFDRVIATAPRHARAHLNRGNALVDLDRIDEAEAGLRVAADLDPGLKEAWTSLGFILTIRGDLAGAVTACDRAIVLDADFAPAQWNRGVALLLGGDFASGFAAYEWRKCHPAWRHRFSPLPAPEWRGEPLAGRHLLIRAEQGYGDTIMLARFLPDLARRAARLTLACRPALFPMFGRMGVGLCQLDALPDTPCDIAIDQMSLPHVLGLTETAIPDSNGYLVADPERAAHWHAEFPAIPGRRRIGLVWAGNPDHGNDRRRSLPHRALTPLLDVPDLDFVGLQIGVRQDEYPIRNLSGSIAGYGDTAAILTNLDAVVTVDTSVAHLAGAMGVPCHILLSAACDWRWRLGRDTTPWYESVVLHRQRRLGDWSGPVASVMAALT